MEHVRLCDDDNDTYPWMVKKMRINENVPHRMTVSQIIPQQAKMIINANVRHRMTVSHINPQQAKMRINENVRHRKTVSQVNPQQAWKGLNAECTLFLEAVWKQNTCDWTACPVTRIFNSDGCRGYTDPFVLVYGLYVWHMEHLFGQIDWVCHPIIRYTAHWGPAPVKFVWKSQGDVTLQVLS